MGHQELNTLSIDILCAIGIVSMRDIWQLGCKALFVEVVLGVESLVLDHVVADHDLVIALLLAVRI